MAAEVGTLVGAMEQGHVRLPLEGQHSLSLGALCPIQGGTNVAENPKNPLLEEGTDATRRCKQYAGREGLVITCN